MFRPVVFAEYGSSLLVDTVISRFRFRNIAINAHNEFSSWNVGLL